MNNYLETYYTRKREINEMLSEMPYTDEEREHTAGAFANSNLDLQEIEDLMNNKPVSGDNKNSRDKDELNFFKQAGWGFQEQEPELEQEGPIKK
jgi:hypothetical protein